MDPALRYRSSSIFQSSKHADYTCTQYLSLSTSIKLLVIHFQPLSFNNDLQKAHRQLDGLNPNMCLLFLLLRSTPLPRHSDSWNPPSLQSQKSGVLSALAQQSASAVGRQLASFARSLARSFWRQFFPMGRQMLATRRRARRRVHSWCCKLSLTGRMELMMTDARNLITHTCLP